MADEPDNLTIRILREIQATLLNHDLRFEQIDQRFEQIDQRFEQVEQRFSAFEQHVDDRFSRMQAQMDYRFDKVDRRLSDVLGTAVTALGSAGHSNVRHDSVQHQIAEVELELRQVKDRLQRLEEKV